MPGGKFIDLPIKMRWDSDVLENCGCGTGGHGKTGIRAFIDRRHRKLVRNEVGKCEKLVRASRKCFCPNFLTTDKSLCICSVVDRDEKEEKCHTGISGENGTTGKVYKNFIF